MALVLAETVRASKNDIGDQNGRLNGVQPTQETLDGEKGPRGSPSNRVAIIGGGIGGISVAHFLINNADQVNPSQVTVFEKEPRFGGRIRFTQIYGHGTTVNTAGHTFDADDMLIEEIANTTSISLRDWWHNGFNTQSWSFTYWMNRLNKEKTNDCPAEESIDMTWTELAGLVQRNMANASFWVRYLEYIRQGLSERSMHRELSNIWDRQSNGCSRRTNPLLWAGSRAKAGQSLELRSRFAATDMNIKPQRELHWNQHDRIFTGLLGELYDHDEFSSHLNSAVTRVTRFSNGTFGVHWTRHTDDGSQEMHVGLFDNVVIAAPFHQAALEIDPPLPSEPEKIVYAPVHVTSIISERLPDSLLLQPHGEQWRTSAALPWPKQLRHATSLPFISVARDHTAQYEFESRPHDLTRVISGKFFSDEDIASLFHGAGITFPNQSCFIPRQAEPDMVQPEYNCVRKEFALAGGAVDKSSGCVDRPTIAWIHRDFWPNGLPLITRDGSRGDDDAELVPGMFYVNGFEGREGASVSKSIASGRKVRDLLVAKDRATQV
ncbi:hypothetical protein F1880_003902 [Penicillium rolfsii]|nr:hypothetical protein F1880_003902 [Penicillium rolfsii]